MAFPTPTNSGVTSPRGGHGAGDAALLWTGLAGTGLFSSPLNWLPPATPGAGDDLTFGVAPLGDYTVFNDLTNTIFATLNVNRLTGTEQVTLQNGFRGTALNVSNGTAQIAGDLVSLGNSVNVSSGANSRATLTLASAANVIADATIGQWQIGAGSDSIAVVNINAGSTGRAKRALSGTTSGESTSTINVQGGGSLWSMTAPGGFLNLSGGKDAGVTLLGTTNLNLSAGGQVTAPKIIFNASNRAGTASPTSLTNVTVAGAASILRSRAPAGAGRIDFAWGDRTTSNQTISNGGLADADTIFLGLGAGAVSTASVTTGGRIETALLVLGLQYRPGDATTSNLTLSNGGAATATSLLSSNGVDGRASVIVDGITSRLDVGGRTFLGGNPSEQTLGTGATSITVRNGATMTAGYLIAGAGSAGAAGASVEGSVLTVDGPGSRLSVNGFVANDSGPTPQTFGGVAILASGTGTHVGLTISNGGVVDLRSGAADLNLDGGLIVAEGTGTSATIEVDGPGSLLNAGTFIQVVAISPATPIQNAVATLNVRNGGGIKVRTNAVSQSGSLLIGTTPSAGSGVLANVGGGAGASDAASSLIADGPVIIGGSIDPRGAPVIGVPTIVNVNHGLASGASVVLYSGSHINIDRGRLNAGYLGMTGGRLMLTSTSVGVGLIDADEIEVIANGVIDVGRSGGISRVFSGAGDSDLAEIRTLIVNGYAGGTWAGLNSITSSAASVDLRLAVGYADIDLSGITSFLGVNFVPADEAIVFRTTLKGDANLDGTVGFPDLVVLAQNYNGVNDHEWYHGDFNYDRAVGFADLVVLAQNYNMSFGPPGSVLAGNGDGAQAFSTDFAADWLLAQSLVPEPTTLAAFFAAASGATRRRRR